MGGFPGSFNGIPNPIPVQQPAVVPAVPGFDPRYGAWDAHASMANQQQNRIDAFRQVFDRPPTSAADRETAAMLDPHSYEAKYAGVAPNIVVGHIQPVPGQGVVRAKHVHPVGEHQGPDLRGVVRR